MDKVYVYTETLLDPAGLTTKVRVIDSSIAKEFWEKKKQALLQAKEENEDFYIGDDKIIITNEEYQYQYALTACTPTTST